MSVIEQTGNGGKAEVHFWWQLVSPVIIKYHTEWCETSHSYHGYTRFVLKNERVRKVSTTTMWSTRPSS